jgi:hypothetical protein
MTHFPEYWVNENEKTLRDLIHLEAIGWFADDETLGDLKDRDNFTAMLAAGSAMIETTSELVSLFLPVIARYRLRGKNYEILVIPSRESRRKEYRPY